MSLLRHAAILAVALELTSCSDPGEPAQLASLNIETLLTLDTISVPLTGTREFRAIGLTQAGVEVTDSSLFRWDVVPNGVFQKVSTAGPRQTLRAVTAGTAKLIVSAGNLSDTIPIKARTNCAADSYQLGQTIADSVTTADCQGRSRILHYVVDSQVTFSLTLRPRFNASVAPIDFGSSWDTPDVLNGSEATRYVLVARRPGGYFIGIYRDPANNGAVSTRDFELSTRVVNTIPCGTLLSSFDATVSGRLSGDCPIYVDDSNNQSRGAQFIQVQAVDSGYISADASSFDFQPGVHVLDSASKLLARSVSDATGRQTHAEYGPVPPKTRLILVVLPKGNLALGAYQVQLKVFRP